MNAHKVTYKTTEGKVFRTIVPKHLQGIEVNTYMTANYCNKITILSIKPTIDKGYKGVINYRVKKLENN